MKKQVLLFLTFSFVFVFSCKKDSFQPLQQETTNQSKQFKRYNWSEKERKFFSLENQLRKNIKARSGAGHLYHHRLVDVYNLIAEQNQDKHFVEYLLIDVGTPLWIEAMVYSHHDIAENAVAIPLVRDGENKINGVIVYHEKPDGTKIIEGKTRKQLIDTLTSESLSSDRLKSQLGYLKWMIGYEKYLFGQSGDDLQNAICIIKRDYNASLQLPPPPPGSEPCIGVYVPMCVHFGTNTWWFGGLNNIPPHLDHDHDGIPNDEDPDFLHLNMSQEDFERLVRQWWDEHYPDDDYDDFWEQDWNEIDWDNEEWGDWDFWDELEDLWDSIMDLFDQDQDHDQFPYGEDHGDNEPPCPWDDPFSGGSSVDERTINCGYFMIWPDCVHDAWWEFAYGDDCGTATGNYLMNYYEANLENIISWQEFQYVIAQSNPVITLCGDYPINYQIYQLVSNYLIQNSGCYDNTYLELSANQFYIWTLQFNYDLPEQLAYKALQFSIDNCGSPDSYEFIEFVFSQIDEISEFKWERFEELYNLVNNDPNFLVNCTNNPTNPPHDVNWWSEIASFVPSQEVIDIVENLGGGSKIQSIQNATGTRINLDYFPVQINQLPNGFFSPNEFLVYIRLNINSFVGNSTLFTPYSQSDHDIWVSSNPYKSVISIDIFPDNGSVVTS